MAIIESLIPWMLNHPEAGWVVVLAYLAYELRGSRGALYQLDKKITSAIIVIRALARTDEKMDEDAVDEYLVENGMEPGDFIQNGTPDQTDAESLHEAESGLIRSDGQGDFDVDSVITEEEERSDQDFTRSD